MKHGAGCCAPSGHCGHSLLVHFFRCLSAAASRARPPQPVTHQTRDIAPQPVPLPRRRILLVVSAASHTRPAPSAPDPRYFCPSASPVSSAPPPPPPPHRRLKHPVPLPRRRLLPRRCRLLTATSSTLQCRLLLPLPPPAPDPRYCSSTCGLQHESQDLTPYLFLLRRRILLTAASRTRPEILPLGRRHSHVACFFRVASSTRPKISLLSLWPPPARDPESRSSAAPPPRRLLQRQIQDPPRTQLPRTTTALRMRFKKVLQVSNAWYKARLNAADYFCLLQNLLLQETLPAINAKAYPFSRLQGIPEECPTAWALTAQSGTQEEAGTGDCGFVGVMDHPHTLLKAINV